MDTKQLMRDQYKLILLKHHEALMTKWIGNGFELSQKELDSITLDYTAQCMHIAEAPYDNPNEPEPWEQLDE